MTMKLLPEKHVRTSESILGLGAIVLASLAVGTKNLDALWADVKDQDSVRPRAHGSITFDTLILAVDFLFAIGAVHMNGEGLLENATR